MYTESLFLFALGGALWSAKEGKWWLAGLFGAALTATRIVGVWIFPALLIEFWFAHQPQQLSFKTLVTFIKQHLRSLIAISSSLLGLGLYMVYLQYHFSDPLYFFHVQSEFGGGRQESLVIWPQVVWRYLKIIRSIPLQSLVGYATIQELLAGTLGLGVIIGGYKKIPLSWIVFSLGAFLTPTLTGTFSSMPRYILVLPSIWVLMAILLQNSTWKRWLWLSLSTAWLMWNTILFVQGYWVA